MVSIRIFILCSAVILCGWLVAAYTYNPYASSAQHTIMALDQADTGPGKQTGSAENAAAEDPQGQMATMAGVENR
jgi:hypothetical protein